ncbi:MULTISPECIES: hypothetical protein [Methylotenera]|uniref:hypothetical protein n=1 Tax=Methylotenera TaxID=359407 RepID=UPI00049217D1|nr:MULTISPECIES: hypothetical protein [Methylotenera]MDP3777564.1 hypothetical protein [Methylotenera sp.]
MKENFTVEQLQERAFLRVARVLFELWEEGCGIHTRILDWLIPDEYVLIGSSTIEASYREHVVPCVVIIDHCILLFEKNTSLEEVANEIRRLLKIAKITREEAEKIDKVLKLKTRMPNGWDVSTGSVLARLEAANIAIEKSHRESHG